MQDSLRISGRNFGMFFKGEQLSGGGPAVAQGLRQGDCIDVYNQWFPHR